MAEALHTDSNGKYRQKSKLVYGSAEAKFAEMQLQTDIKKEPSHKMTVQNLFDEYMVAKKQYVRQSTLEKSKRVLKQYVIANLGELRIDRINVKQLQSWKNLIAEQDLKIRTKQNIYKELHALLEFAVKLEYLQRNPLNTLGNFAEPNFIMPENKIQYYTADEFKKYIAAAKKCTDSMIDYGCYVFFNITFYTGMRKGEINALKWTDIDGDIIHVRRSVCQKNKGEPCTETPPKNKSSYRDLQMPDPLLNILNAHQNLQRHMPCYTDDFRVCGGATCLSDTAISNHNIKYAEISGLPVIRTHDFRHTHATLLANSGINIQEIARRLGHSDVKQTWNTYAHLYPAEEERAVKILNEIK